MAAAEAAQAGVCRVTLFVPFWLNNRTGVDLFYRDRHSAPPQPLLLGASLPWDYGEVFTPGTSMTEAFDGGASEAGSDAPWARAAAGAAASAASQQSGGKQSVLEYKLVLMNKQEEVRLGLAHVRRRRYAQPVPIKTAGERERGGAVWVRRAQTIDDNAIFTLAFARVSELCFRASAGNKGSVELRGPAAAEPTVPQQVAAGLRQAVAVPGAALGALRNLRAESEASSDDGAPRAPAAGGSHDLAAHAAAATPSLARRSIGAGGTMDVVSKEAGTMLVRLTSSGSAARRQRKLPSVLRRSSASLPPSTAGSAFPAVLEEEAEAALEAMQRLPAPSVGAGLVEGEGEPTTRDQLSEAAAADAGAAPAAEGSEEGGPARSGPSLTTHQAFLAPVAGQSVQEAAELAAAQGRAGGARRPPTKGQRLFEFAVDVAAGPPSSIYRHTKLVTLKPKYIIENQTGVGVEVKQLNTPDPGGDGAVPASRGFARLLPPGARAAVYWDDAELARELVVRPRPPGEPRDAWHWSGGFPIPDTEWYFGLRIRHRAGARRYMNIPVNVTVGASGSVQVTLKSPASVPPYRIENMCKDVMLYFVQASCFFLPLFSPVHAL
jgi:hypothetical protein